ncbi:MAG: class I tRNA ligase family protein, partial [Candidatus Spechtbacteria bacterium]|nr:class I tRNA ligase family protein [Candidatus Spechtbacteria bacterium]
VTTEEGTGIVHTAVMYGEDDYNLGEKLGLPKVHTVDESGKFNNLVPKWQGKFVKDAEPEIIADLFARNLLYKKEPHIHSYPFCWRCKWPLLYYARPSWFIRMASLRGKLLKNNSTINWIPKHIKEGRFGEWLKEVKDWNFSRSRYWGTPLPIWKCEKCGYVRIVGSIKELGTQAPRNERGEIDLHRPYVDEVFFQCPSCKDASSDAMKRVPELADVWFDSGAMPFASGAAGYPADYISEAIDQTRGWFYTLLAVAAVLGKRAPYKNVISLGHVLDKHGKKMSKSVGNTVDPWIIIQKYGSDALRWYFYTLNQPGDYKKFDENDVRKTYGKFISTLLNTVLFYKTYSQEKSGKFYNPKHVLDKWVISRLNGLILDVGKKLDLYDITGAARDVENFTINDLSNWYIRRSRKRFQTPRTKGEKKEAEQVLGFVLLEVSKLCAPFIPFLSEHMHQELQYTIYNIRYTRSVHWENFPKADTKHIKKKIEGEMAKARKVVEMGHELRARAGIKVRQPLSQLTASVKFSKEMSAIMADELNLKVVEYKMKDGFQVENEFWKVNTEGDILVALNTEMTKELREEGFVKELMRHVQESRKAAGLRPKDRIEIYYSTSKELGEIIQRWAIPLKRQNNANVIQEVEGRREDGEGWGEFAWEGNKVWVGIKK